MPNDSQANDDSKIEPHSGSPVPQSFGLSELLRLSRVMIELPDVDFEMILLSLRRMPVLEIANRNGMRTSEVCERLNRAWRLLSDEFPELFSSDNDSEV